MQTSKHRIITCEISIKAAYSEHFICRKSKHKLKILIRIVPLIAVKETIEKTITRCTVLSRKENQISLVAFRKQNSNSIVMSRSVVLLVRYYHFASYMRYIQNNNTLNKSITDKHPQLNIVSLKLMAHNNKTLHGNI